MSVLNKILLSILLTVSVPAYNLGTPIDYFKCLIFDECNKHQEEL